MQAAPRLLLPGLDVLLAETRGLFELNASLLLSPLLMRAEVRLASHVGLG